MKLSEFLATIFIVCLIHFGVSAQSAKLVLPYTHSKRVNDIKYSSDNRFILTAGDDGMLKVWGLSGKSLIKNIEHNVEIMHISTCTNPNQVLTQSDGRIKIWDLKEGNLIKEILSDYCKDALFSADGNQILTKNINKSYLYSTTSGELIRSFEIDDEIKQILLINQGKRVIQCGWEGKLRIWETETGQLIKTPIGHYKNIIAGQNSNTFWAISDSTLIHFNSDGEILSKQDSVFEIVANSEDNSRVVIKKKGSLEVKDLSSWKTIATIQSPLVIEKAWIDDTHNQLIAYGPKKRIYNEDQKYQLEYWDLKNMSLIKAIETLHSYAIIYNSKLHSICYIDEQGKIHHLPTAKPEQEIVFGKNSTKLIYSLVSPDSSRFITVNEGGYPRIWNIDNGKPIYSLNIVESFINREKDKGFFDVYEELELHHSPKGKYIWGVQKKRGSDNFSILLWDSKSGSLLTSIDHAYSSNFYFSPNEKEIFLPRFFPDDPTTIGIWNIESDSITGYLPLSIIEKNKQAPDLYDPIPFGIRFSPDGQKLIIEFYYETTDGRSLKGMSMWNTSNYTQLLFEPRIEFNAFSPDSRQLLVTYNHALHILDAEKAPETLETVFKTKSNMTIQSKEYSFIEASFDNTGKYVYSLFRDDGYKKAKDSLQVWKIHDMRGNVDRSIEIATRITNELKKKHSNLFLYKNKVLNNYYDFLALESNDSLLLKFYPIDSTDWLITHPTGLFDASDGAMRSLHFNQGLEIIDFTQLKDRYYEPGLWKKVMFGEELRNVVGMKSIELPPDIQVSEVDSKGYLPIELTNKGGGIGEVTILINGKEAIVDARPKGSDSKAKQLSLKVFIGNHKALVKGAENYIAVKAWNEGHWVVSRGSVVTYSAKGTETTYKPAIHIITIGISDYKGTELDLKYAAKDAEDVSKALQLGAKQLFGTDKSYIYKLTTSQPIDQNPSKTNILRAFEKVSSVAHPLDVVVVYLSGHGINHGGQDGDWYYLTQDAYTASSTAYNDPEIRRTSTLSSNELVELFKKVPALKQVLMIDACASGKVVENLMAQKDIESTTLRALDRMRDRTGLHIITGCTADAVSYEASKYGQGVLTYSLLEGIRGAALREDQFIDVNKLFQYAHERVPALAEGIGGIQTPQLFSPQGGQSFDIGLLTEQEKKDIPIAIIRPVYIRSSFIDDDQLEDALQLGKKIDEALNEAASKSTSASLIFVDVREYPEGCKLSGRYKQEGGIIKLKLRKKCEGKDETLEINGKTVEEVRNKIISIL